MFGRYRSVFLHLQGVYIIKTHFISIFLLRLNLGDKEWYKCLLFGWDN